MTIKYHLFFLKELNNFYPTKFQDSLKIVEYEHESSSRYHDESLACDV